MQCPNCNKDFEMNTRFLLTQTKLNRKILNCRIRCPECQTAFDYDGDPEAESTNMLVANPRSTLRVPPVGTRYPRQAPLVPKYKLSKDWYDFCGPHIENVRRELSYYENQSQAFPLSEQQEKERDFWMEQLIELTRLKEEAEKRLRERGELDDTV